MRRIKAGKIKGIVADLSLRANLSLRKDVLAALKAAYAKEGNPRARDILQAIIENAAVAEKERLAICQDTGMPVVFVELGQGVQVEGDFLAAINQGIEKGYRKACLRNSVVRDPINRGTPQFSPAVIHLDMVKGRRIKVTVLPKGFGCENKSALKMFKPTASQEEIKKFILDTVKAAGPDACPPYVVGVGIGGTADYASLLAKKALLKTKDHRPKTRDQKLGQELLREINKLNIGPMGLGGRTTALAVNIETYPTHIAGLPVAVNISCHALRIASKII